MGGRGKVERCKMYGLRVLLEIAVLCLMHGTSLDISFIIIVISGVIV